MIAVDYQDEPAYGMGHVDYFYVFPPRTKQETAGYRISGWALSSDGGRPADRVLVTDEHGQLLAETVPDRMRGDVAHVKGNGKLGASGWTVDIVTSQPFSELRVYSLDDGAPQARRLPGIALPKAAAAVVAAGGQQNFQPPPERWTNEWVNDLEIGARRTTLTSLPRWINLELTERCNLNCRTCYRFDSDYVGRDILPPVLDKVRTELLPAASLVSFNGGGESPLYDGWDAVVAESTRHDYIPQLNTNLTMFRPESLEALVDAGFELHLSIDAATEETLRYLRGTSLRGVVKKVERLVAYRDRTGNRQFKLFIVFVPSVVNLKELPKMVEMAAEWGVERLVVPVFRAGGAGCEELNPDNVPKLANDMYLEAVRKAEMLGVEIQIPALYPLTGQEDDMLLAALEEGSRARLASGAKALQDLRTVEDPDHDYLDRFKASLSRDEQELIAESQAPASQIEGALEQVTRKHRSFCQYPFFQFYVMSTGDVHPCCFGGPLMGSLIYNSAAELWNGLRWQELRAALIDGKPPSECQNCPWNIS